MRLNDLRYHWKGIIACLWRKNIHRFFNPGDRYILSFPNRLAPYDRRFCFDYFNCGHYEEIFPHYNTFSLEEARELKNRLESKGDGKGGVFWDLQICKVLLICKTKMLYSLSN